MYWGFILSKPNNNFTKMFWYMEIWMLKYIKESAFVSLWEALFVNEAKGITERKTSKIE